MCFQQYTQFLISYTEVITQKKKNGERIINYYLFNNWYYIINLLVFKAKKYVYRCK